MVNRINMPEYPNRIREWRELRGLTQDELAGKIGSYKSHISSWELGKTDIAMRWMKRISDALDVSVSDLLSFRDNPNAADEKVTNLVRHYKSSSAEGQFLILELAKKAAGSA
jgi:transcriptional regulator with XRE-family HTH domain